MRHDLQQNSCSDAPAVLRSGALRSRRKVVLVHAGARDGYQLALGLFEHGLLDTLVTDLFWPPENPWTSWVTKCLPALASRLQQRGAPGLPFSAVRLLPLRGLSTLLVEQLHRTPSTLRRAAHRAADAALGRTAGQIAAKRRAGLVSYSYYGFAAMRAFGQPCMLFQLHPHPATVREILLQELRDHPDCAESLLQEWELSLPEEDFRHLVQESALAARFLVASTFTRNSLIAHGVDPAAITVVPYGVDLQRFHPHPQRPRRSPGDPLRLLFVGRINQRKGVKYLLQTLYLLRDENVQLTICGRVVDSLALFLETGLPIEIRPSVSAAQLVEAYQSADLFVFPSVAEGFGQVLLESLACGCPLLSTPRTAAPDLITEGEEGFIVEPCRPDLLAERIRWCMTHPEELETMRVKARQAAERFTWARFRNQTAEAVNTYLVDLP